MLAGLSASDQRLASPEDERLDLLGAHAEDRGDVLLRVVAELEEDQGGALVGGKPAHVVQHLAKVLTALDLVSEALEDGLIAAQLLHPDVRATPARRRQTAVAA